MMYAQHERHEESKQAQEILFDGQDSKRIPLDPPANPGIQEAEQYDFDPMWQQ